MNKNFEPESVKKLKIWTKACIIIATISSILGLAFFIVGYIKYDNLSKNELGDYIGGVSGSLWSFAGVLMVAVAFIYQQIQIEFQKIEISEAREDSRKQYFENTFFSLLNLHHRILSNIDIASGSDKLTGSDCFDSFLSEFKSEYNKADEQEDEYLRLKETATEFFKNKSGELSHYIANVSSIIKFVDKSFYQEIDINIDDPTLKENKMVYYDIINAQLSSFELVILLYNSVLDIDLMQNLKKLRLKDKFQPQFLITENHLELLLSMDNRMK